MELRHLRYFVAVAEELHFRRAAERLNVTQPAVSEQVRNLEEELGVLLLNRTQRNVSLTEAGAVLLGNARRVLQQADVAQAAAHHAWSRAASARLRIGYMPTVLPARVPRALQRLVAATPSLQTSLEPGACSDLIEAVREERLDVAIVSLPAPNAGLRMTALGEQQAVAALPLSHRDAGSGEIRLDQMAPERIMVPSREANRPFHDAVVAACRNVGLSPTLVEMSGGNIEQTLLAVASGAGMALVPQSLAERYGPPGVRFVPLSGNQLVFATAVVTRHESEHVPTLAFLRSVASQNVRQPARSRHAPDSVHA